MCGIAAILSPREETCLSRVASEMVERLRHRGPDDGGLETFAGARAVARGEPCTVALAHRRLAIQDLTDAAHQPMSDPDDRYRLLFNGEIYNFLELRETLERAGERFRSRGDTEVLLRLLARDGVDALPELDGMFAILLYDRTTRTLIAARDRFGIKPLYTWTDPDGAVHFASEIKAFTACPGWRAALNGPRAADYLRRGLIDHTPETLFAGVRQVAAGTWLQVDLGALDRTPVEQRWYAPRAAALDIAPGDRAEHFRALLSTSVRRRLRADVTVGSCLSGGLDSSAVVALAAEALREHGANEGQITVTARVPEDEALDEWRYAREAAAMAGARPVAVTPEAGELLDRLDEMVWIHDEPFGSPSIFAQYRVFQAAAEHGATVMLDGQGADEQLCGYQAFFPVCLVELLRTGRVPAALRLLRGARRAHGIPGAALLARALASILPAGTLRRLRRRDSAHEVIDFESLGSVAIDPFDAMTGRRYGVEAFSIDQLTRGSLPMLLHWEDRNSMAHSIEARVPFLYPALVEFDLSLPPTAKIDGPWTKAILREALRDDLPESILRRTDKVAFATPERHWLGGANADRVQSVLDDALEGCGTIVGDAGRAVLAAIVTGDRPYDPILWRVLCFGLWMRRFEVAG